MNELATELSELIETSKRAEGAFGDDPGLRRTLHEIIMRACFRCGRPKFEKLPTPVQTACSITSFGFEKKHSLKTILNQLEYALDVPQPPARPESRAPAQTIERAGIRWVQEDDHVWVRESLVGESVRVVRCDRGWIWKLDHFGDLDEASVAEANAEAAIEAFMRANRG